MKALPAAEFCKFYYNARYRLVRGSAKSNRFNTPIGQHLVNSQRQHLARRSRVRRRDVNLGSENARTQVPHLPNQSGPTFRRARRVSRGCDDLLSWSVE